MNAAFYAAIRPIFGGKMSQKQVDGVEAILAATKGLPVSQRAYVLATAHHETGGGMQPVKETVFPWSKNKNPTDAQVIAALDRAFKAGKLRGVKTPYWREGWFGRGYVQLTHLRNYREASKLAWVDLVADRDKALDPLIAAKVLAGGMKAGTFTGHKLDDYLPGDFVGARRIVNSADQAQKIAETARQFEAALMRDSVPAPDYPAAPAPAPENWPAKLIAAVAAFLKGLRK
jgi:predicted chitinase